MDADAVDTDFGAGIVGENAIITVIHPRVSSFERGADDDLAGIGERCGGVIIGIATECAAKTGIGYTVNVNLAVGIVVENSLVIQPRTINTQCDADRDLS